MFLGKAVKTEKPERVLIFHPRLRKSENIPFYGDEYLIMKGVNPADMSSRFPKSVSVSPSGYDMDKKDNILKLMAEEKKIPKSHWEIFEQLRQEEFWDIMPFYYLTRSFPPMVAQDSSFYRLFASIGKQKALLIKEFFNVSDIPLPVQLSIMLTFMQKARFVNKISGLNNSYASSLKNLQAYLPKLKQPLIKYLQSDRERSDFLHFLLSSN